MNYADVSMKETAGPRGLYVTAIANGIQAILNDYLDLLTDLEMRLIQDLNLTFNYLRAAVEKYREIFTALVSLVHRVSLRCNGLMFDVRKLILTVCYR